ncbi:unnamed protein product [Brassica rapa subsp. trilocularis]
MLYQDNPFAQTNPYVSSSPNLYPPVSSSPNHGDSSNNQPPSAPPQAVEEVHIRVPGAIPTSSTNHTAWSSRAAISPSFESCRERASSPFSPTSLTRSSGR